MARIATLFFAFVVVSLVACSGGSSLYEPIGVDDIEAGKKPPGLAELGAHVAIVGSIRCHPQSKPDRCFYRAVANNSQAARRQERGEKEALFGQDDGPFVIVRINPGAEKEAGFAQRPVMQGRFTNLALLGYEDQKAFLSLNVSLRDAMLFQPDTGAAGIFGWGTMMWPILIGLPLLFILLLVVAARVARGGDRMTSRASPLPPSPATWKSAEPSEASTPSRTEGSLPPGTSVVIRRDNGVAAHATIVEAAPGRYLCEIGEGRRAWVTADRVTPSV